MTTDEQITVISKMQFCSTTCSVWFKNCWAGSGWWRDSAEFAFFGDYTGTL